MDITKIKEAKECIETIQGIERLLEEIKIGDFYLRICQGIDTRGNVAPMHYGFLSEILKKHSEMIIEEIKELREEKIQELSNM